MNRWLNSLQPWALFFLRVALGAAMLFHGFQKLIPAGGLHRSDLLAGFHSFNHFVATLGLPPWLGYVSLCTELFGGLFLIVGFLTRLSALFVAGNMLVALVFVNLHHGYAASEYTLALITMAALLVTTGSGAAAFDRSMGL